MAARPAALMRCFFGAALVPVAFAHRIFRAFARALISFRRCAADRRRLVRLTGTGVSAGLAASALDSPPMASSCPSNDSICSLSARTRRRSATERSQKDQESDFIQKRMPVDSRESNTGFADSAFSNRAPSAPACCSSLFPEWRERGRSFRYVGFFGGGASPESQNSKADQKSYR